MQVGKAACLRGSGLVLDCFSDGHLPPGQLPPLVEVKLNEFMTVHNLMVRPAPGGAIRRLFRQQVCSTCVYGSPLHYAPAFEGDSTLGET